MNKDLAAIRDAYGSRGFVFADVQADPRFLEEPGTLDLVYNVKEGNRYRVGKVNVNITGDDTHTSSNVVWNRLSLRPGDILDTTRLRSDERRSGASSVFDTKPGKAQRSSSARRLASKTMARAWPANRPAGPACLAPAGRAIQPVLQAPVAPATAIRAARRATGRRIRSARLRVQTIAAKPPTRTTTTAITTCP